MATSTINLEGTSTANGPIERVPVPDPTKLTTVLLHREIGNLREIVFTRIDGMDTALRLANENIGQRSNETEKLVDQVKQLISARIDGMDRALVLANEAIGRSPSDAEKLVEQLNLVLSTRLDGYDKATEILQNITDRVPKSVDEKIGALREIQDEKFTSIQLQFRERDVRTEQTSKDSKVAVDAALQAAKEAVGEQNKSSALAISKSEASTVKQIDQMGLLIQTGQKAVDDKFSDIKDRLTRIEGRDVGKVIADTTHQTADQMRQGSNGNMIAIVSCVIAVASVLAVIVTAMMKR